MDTLAPPLRLVQTLRYTLESGESLRAGLRHYLGQAPDDFTLQVQAWWQLIERGCATEELLSRIRSPYRRQLFQVVEKGLRGESVLTALCSLDEEMQEQANLELERFLGQLPLRMLLPLLFFLFPAFLLLLLGPIFMQVMSGMAG